MSDVGNARAIIIVFAMPSCPACHEYLPRFERELKRWQEHHAPFERHAPGKAYTRGQIPVAIYDVTSQDQSLQDLCNTYGVESLPTTLLLTWNRSAVKLEGAIGDDEVYGVFHSAMLANR